MKSSKFTSTPLFPRQALVALLLPLIAEQALSVTIGLADTLMVSSVGEAAVSGVSLVDSFNTLMIQIMSALATGGAVVTSQYIGHQEPKNAKAAAAQILFVLSSFSVLVAAVVIGGRHAILRGIFGSIDADVMHYAETYFLLSALSYPFIGLYNAGAALFRAQGNSKISMLSSSGDERGEHRRQRGADLRLRHGGHGRGAGQPCVPRHCLRGGAVSAAKAGLRPAGGQPAGNGAERRADPAHPAGGHPCRHRERDVPDRQAVGLQPDLHPWHGSHCRKCGGQYHHHLF